MDVSIKDLVRVLKNTAEVMTDKTANIKDVMINFNDKSGVNIRYHEGSEDEVYVRIDDAWHQLFPDDIDALKKLF